MAMFRSKIKPLIVATLCVSMFTQGIAVYASDVKSITAEKTANGATFIKIDGLVRAFKTPVKEVNGVSMVTMTELAKYLDAQTKWDDKAKTMKATRGEKTIVVKSGSNVATVNGKEAEMPGTAVMEVGTISVPLKFVAEALGAKVTWNEKLKSIEIDTGKTALNVLALNVPKSKDTKVYTYEKALEEAQATNSSLKNLEDSLTVLEDSYDKVKDSLFTSLEGFTNTKYISTIRGITSIQNNISNVDLQRQMLKEATELLLRSSLTNIATNEMDLQLAKENLTLQQENLKYTELKESLGMASEIELKQAKQDIEQTSGNIKSLELLIANEKSALCKLMGISQDKDVVVDVKPEVKKTGIPSLGNYISTKMENDPNLTILQRKIDEAQLKLDTTLVESGETKLELETNLSSLERDYEDKERNLESTIRSSYTQLMQLAEKEKNLQVDLQKAKDTYNTMEARYQAGLITLYDLDKTRVAILSAEVSLLKNAYQHWNLYYALEHPYLSAGKGAAE